MNVYHESQVPWPASKAKTSSRNRGQFQTNLADACTRIEKAVSAFTRPGQGWRTSELWIYADAQLGAQNRFLANQRSSVDPAVVVRFDLDRTTFTIATDRFTDAAQNLAGIAAYIESVRAQERYGIFEVTEMLSFAALPAPNQWFAGCATRAEIETRYRELAMEHHPDRNGGDTATMAEINEAKALAMQAVSE